MTEKLDIGTRMKGYENVTRISLTKRTPVIIRVDGKAFHTLTKKFYGKKYDFGFVSIMMEVTKHVVDNIQGCSFAYSQSDEISFLLTDYKTLNTQGWFDYNLNKLVSVSASCASSKFTKISGVEVCFDSRAFCVPKEEVCNYFLWRQLDATRNAIQMLGQEYFSHKQLHKKTCAMIQEMLYQEHGINFNDCLTLRKRGFCYSEGDIDYGIPIFSQDRNYIEKWVYLD